MSQFISLVNTSAYVETCTYVTITGLRKMHYVVLLKHESAFAKHI